MGVFIIFYFFALRVAYAQDALHQRCSLEWHRRNAHLIPDSIEAEAIRALDQSYSKPWRARPRCGWRWCAQ